MLGIVIHAEKVKEADVKIQILTPEGLQKFTLTGAQKATAKLKSAAQIFTLADYNIQGHKIIGAHVHDQHFNITRDIKRYYLACAICETVSQIYKHSPLVERDGAEGDGVFKLTLAAMKSLDDGGNVREIYADYFTALLRELGYDVLPDQSINHAYLQHLDIKIPNTGFFLTCP